MWQLLFRLEATDGRKHFGVRSGLAWDRGRSVARLAHFLPAELSWPFAWYNCMELIFDFGIGCADG